MRVVYYVTFKYHHLFKLNVSLCYKELLSHTVCYRGFIVPYSGTPSVQAAHCSGSSSHITTGSGL